MSEFPWPGDNLCLFRVRLDVNWYMCSLDNLASWHCMRWKCPSKTLQWSALMSCIALTIQFHQVHTSSGLQLLPEINSMSWKVTHYSLHLERIPQLEISNYISSMSSTFSLNLTLPASSLFPISLQFSTVRCIFVQVFIGSSLCWDWVPLISHWKSC